MPPPNPNGLEPSSSEPSDAWQRNVSGQAKDGKNIAAGLVRAYQVRTLQHSLAQVAQVMRHEVLPLGGRIFGTGGKIGCQAGHSLKLPAQGLGAQHFGIVSRCMIASYHFMILQGVSPALARELLEAAGASASAEALTDEQWQSLHHQWQRWLNALATGSFSAIADSSTGRMSVLGGSGSSATTGAHGSVHQMLDEYFRGREVPAQPLSACQLCIHRHAG